MASDRLLLLLTLLHVISTTVFSEQRNVSCYSCLDVFVLETESPQNSSAVPLYDELVDVVFYGIDPANCTQPTLVECSSNEICFVLEAHAVETHRGVSVHADFTLSRCLDRREPEYEKALPYGCFDANKASDMDPWEEYLNFTFTELSGVACTCGDTACNDPREHSGRYCYSCLDVTILDTDRHINSSVVSLYTKNVELGFGGEDPGSCDLPSLVKCSPNEICLTVQAVLTGTYSGINGRADLLLSRCVDPAQPGFENVPETGCIKNDKAYDFIQWGRILDSAIAEATGVTCSCTESACNDPRDHRGMYCYHCLDLEADDSLNHMEASVAPLYQSIVARDFSEVAPPSCSSPSLLKCSGMETMCLSVELDLNGEGLSTNYDGETCKVTLSQALCLDPTNERYEHVPQSACRRHDVLYMYDLSEWQADCYRYFTSVSGATCTCDEAACNFPKGFPCSYCKNVDADFGNKSINQMVRTQMVRTRAMLFDFSAPECSYVNTAHCEAGGSCAKLTFDIHGSYEGHDGILQITYHHCMTSSQLNKMHQMGMDVSSECFNISRDTLVQVYGDTLTKQFSRIQKFEGNLCLCQRYLCNKPQQATVKPTSSATRYHMCPVFVTLIILHIFLK